MARAWFGRGSEDFFVAGPLAPGDSYRTPPQAIEVTFWDAETGGTQYTDLLLDGTTPVDSITVPTTGQPPAFQGPDGVVAMWAQAGNSTTRRMMDAGADIATQVAADREAVAADRAAVEAVGTTNDTVIASRINDPESATAAALLTSTDAQVTEAGGTRDKLDLRYRYGNRRVITVADLPETGIVNAHRLGGGGERLCHLGPDGALSSARVAFALGAHILDVDTQLSKEGVPVDLHDANLLKATGVNLNAADVPFYAMPPIDMRWSVGDGWGTEPLSTVEAFLAEFGGRVVMTCEAKGGVPGVAPLADLIKSYGLERSVFINSSDPAVAAEVTAQGCLAHVYNCNTLTAIANAAAAGAYMVEIAHNCDPSLIAAAQGATNIQIILAEPIYRRVEKAAMTPGFNGYCTDAIGYLETVVDDHDIARQIASKKVGVGWLRFGYTWQQGQAFPILPAAATGVSMSNGAQNRSRAVLLGNLAGPKPGTYSFTTKWDFGAWTSDANTRIRINVCCPDDSGTGTDADTVGYQIGLRKNGNLYLWRHPVGGGSGTQIGTVATTAIPDAGQTGIEIRVDVTPTTIGVTRVDTGHSIAAVADTAWRGDYVWVGGSSGGSAHHDTWLTAASWA